MAEFKLAYKKVIELEYGNDPNKFLHLNKHEDGYTLGGIYQKWNKEAIDWDFIDRIITMCRGDISLASNLLYWDKDLHMQVYTAFEYKYWKRHRLGEIKSQLIAEEIIISLVNIGNKAIRFAQQILGISDDGIVGNITLKELNSFDEKKFSELFDIKEIENYNNIIKANPLMAINLTGWLNRSKAV